MDKLSARGIAGLSYLAIVLILLWVCIFKPLLTYYVWSIILPLN